MKTHTTPTGIETLKFESDYKLTKDELLGFLEITEEELLAVDYKTNLFRRLFYMCKYAVTVNYKLKTDGNT